ncbi:MAG: hypothetical protein U5J83_14905, partial [Bryobacterales bacterium]|nr:hypothetical protein [Bryobacterales bacterium]
SKLDTIQQRRKAADRILAAQPFSKQVPQTTTGAPEPNLVLFLAPPQRHRCTRPALGPPEPSPSTPRLKP